MPVGPQTAKPLALLLGEAFILHTSPILACREDMLLWLFESELEAHKTRDKGAVTPIVLVLLHPTGSPPALCLGLWCQHCQADELHGSSEKISIPWNLFCLILWHKGPSLAKPVCLK